MTIVIKKGATKEEVEKLLLEVNKNLRRKRVCGMFTEKTLSKVTQ